jgi:hypothetical protein
MNGRIHSRALIALISNISFIHRSPSKALRTIALILGGFLLTWGPTLTLIFVEAYTAILEFTDDDEEASTGTSAIAEALISSPRLNGTDPFEVFDEYADNALVASALTLLRDDADFAPAVSSIVRRLARFAFYLNTIYHPLVYGIYPKVIRAGISTLMFRSWHRARDGVVRRWRGLLKAAGMSTRCRPQGIHALRRQQTPLRRGVVNDMQLAGAQTTV